MKRYLLDTNHASDCIFRRRGIDTRVLASRRSGNHVGIGIPVLAESFGGVEYSSTRETNLQVVQRNLGLFRLWPFTTDAAREYGRIYAELRRGGRPMQSIDIMIAAIALTLGNCTVVSSDTDFLAIKGLTVENWLTIP